MRVDFAEDLRLPHPAGNELRDLGAKIENEDFLMRHGSGVKGQNYKVTGFYLKQDEQALKLAITGQSHKCPALLDRVTMCSCKGRAARARKPSAPRNNQTGVCNAPLQVLSSIKSSIKSKTLQ
jgi:hypothetical protein